MYVILGQGVIGFFREMFFVEVACIEPEGDTCDDISATFW